MLERIENFKIDPRVFQLCDYLESIDRRLTNIERFTKQINDVTQLIDKEIKRMAPTLDDVLADVTAESTVEDSVITLLNGISAQLKAANGDPTKIQAIKDGLDANIAKLNAALTSNTPAPAPAPAAPAVVPPSVVIAAAMPSATPDTVVAAATAAGVTDPSVAAAAADPAATPASVAAAVVAVATPAPATS